MNGKKLSLFFVAAVCCWGVGIPIRVEAQQPSSARDAQTAIGTESASSGPVARQLTMEQSIWMAQQRSISSMVNKNVYAAAYWNNRSYKASRLPSLNFRAGLGNIQRARVPLQDATTGEFNYRDVFNMSNDVSLYVNQNIPATGGTLQVISSLRRLDQFIASDNPVTLFSQPITVSYVQPLFGFNSFKWEKKIEPHLFEKAKSDYLERMEDVTIRAVDYFWRMAIARLDYDVAVENYEGKKDLYRIAEERHKIGSLGRDELLQLQLGVLNDSLAINSRYIEYTTQKNRLASFIGLREDAEFALDISGELPDLRLDYERVLATAKANSSFELGQQIALLEAERGIAQAKGNRGIDVSFNARFGLSQDGNTFSSAYSRFKDEEIAGFSVSVPILDWGQGRGRVKMARSNAERIRYEQEQALIDYEQEILVQVMEFNAQKNQCDASRRANDIAAERYELSVESFSRGTLSVTELNTAQNEKNSAEKNYIASLNAYWSSYYTLRKMTLYDYLSNTDIGAAFDFDKLIEE